MQDAIDSIMDDDDVTLETVLEDGLRVHSVFQDSFLSGYPLTKESTLLHWTAAYDALKCAKVRRRQHRQGQTHSLSTAPLTLCDTHFHFRPFSAGAPETWCEG